MHELAAMRGCLSARQYNSQAAPACTAVTAALSVQQCEASAMTSAASVTSQRVTVVSCDAVASWEARLLPVIILPVLPVKMVLQLPASDSQQPTRPPMPASSSS